MVLMVVCCDDCARYFRLSTRPVEQPSRTLDAEVEYGLLRGGYWHGPSPSPDTQLVIAVSGVVTPEALKAADEMRSELGAASEGSDVCVLQVRSRPHSPRCMLRQAARRAQLPLDGFDSEKRQSSADES